MFFWCCQSWLHYTAPKIKHTQTTATITLTFSSTDPLSKLSFINSPQCFSVNKQSFFQCLWSTSIAEKRLIYPLQPLPGHQEELLLGFNARFIRKSSSKCSISVSNAFRSQNKIKIFSSCLAGWEHAVYGFKGNYSRIKLHIKEYDYSTFWKWKINKSGNDRSQRAWLTGDLTNQNADILRPPAILHLARQLRPVSIEMHVKTG